MVKSQYRCLNDQCGIVISTPREMDGMNCHRCGGIVFPEPFNPNIEHVPYVPLKNRGRRINLAYQCLCCGYKNRVEGKKEDYSEVKVCPKCNGAFVDVWKIERYRDKKKKPLLQIELTDINSVPTVYYKGEKIDKKIRVSFDYMTDTEQINPNYIHIEYAEVESEGFNTKTIQYNQPIDRLDNQ